MKSSSQRNSPLSSSLTKTTKPQLSNKQIQEAIQGCKGKTIKIQEVSDEKQGVLQALNAGVLGQKEACEEIADGIDVGLNRVMHKKGPLGVFFLAGPTGVGKTETVRMLAEYFLGDEEAFIFIPGEKFQEEYDVAKLHGSADGLVGFGKKKYFHKVGEDYRKAIRSGSVHPHVQDNKDFSILLIDEAEKMHPAVHQSLLSVLEEGKAEVVTNTGDDNSNSYTDEVIDFSNTLIFLTSNIGEAEIAKMKSKSPIGFRKGTSQKDETNHQDIFTNSLKDVFSPEFLGRVGTPIRFKNLSREEAGEIIEKRVTDITSYLTGYFKKWNIHVGITPESVEFMLDRGFSGATGARGVGRVVKKYIEGPVNRILKEYQNNEILNRKNPTIINFDLSQDQESLTTTLYLPDIIEEEAIVDSDEILDVSNETVDAVKEILEKTRRMGVITNRLDTMYEELEEDGFSEEEVQILIDLDTQYILGIIFDSENFPNRSNILQTSNVFGENFPPRWIRSLVDRKVRDINAMEGNYYSKEHFILKSIVKIIPIIENILGVSQLSQEQEEAIIKFVIISALKIF